MPFIHIPAYALDKLELAELRLYVQKHALGDMAKTAINKETVIVDPEEVLNSYRPVASMQHLLAQEMDLPLQAYEDISLSLKHLKAEGYILEQEEVVSIYKQLIIARDLVLASKKFEAEEFNPIKAIISTLNVPKRIIDECQNLFTESFEVREDASQELLRVQRSIERTKRLLDREFSTFLKAYADKGYLSDTAETIRSGRRVLSVKSEHKRQIKGIIHDESSGGRVTYIEPEAIVEINNDLFDLIQAKKREILRLIKALCKTISSYKEELDHLQEIIIQLDIVRAKALFGRQIEGICPKIKKGLSLQIKKGRHPLLLIHHRDKGEKVVPFDLQLKDQNHLLIVSGPNAGGKTILMKSVGLLQLMVQTAIPVPVDPVSEFGIFQKIFVDIGDQQSLEDDLSTYSSHLKNMKSFLDSADGETLLLIDELGSGTDPRIGGAIAEAILHDMLKKGVHGVITTHYSNLKNYAHRQKGVVNAAMSFDSEELSPTYELMIGKPGSSFAFELAQKSRLPENVIQNAKKNAGSELVNIDKMLSDIQSQRKTLQERIAEVESREKEIDRIRSTYEQMRKDIEGQRKKLKMMAKEYDVTKGVEIDKAMQDMMQEIRQAKDLEKAKELAKKETEKKESSIKELAELEEQDWKERQKDVERKIEVGDFVKLRKTGTVGQVERLEKGKAMINTGNFQLQAKLKDLVPAHEPMDVNKQKSVTIQTGSSSNQSIQSKLDIRGLPRAEANRLLEKYFDQALLQGVHRLEIIHGKGSGVLKKLVQEKARQLDAVESIEHPPNEAGGEGVSVIKL